MAEAIWERKGTEKREAVQGMFARIAPRYDRLNGLMSGGLHRAWRAAAVRSLALKPGDAAIDVCSGTGDFLLPLRAAVGPTGRLLATDFCAPMLERADVKDDRAGRALGDACRLPVASNAFRGLTVGWGIRNVPDVDAAHREAFRVLMSGGRFASVEMATPVRPLAWAISTFLFRRVVPALGRLFGHAEAYAYLPESTLRHKSREELTRSMEEAGFVDVAARDLFFGNLCLHTGKKP